MAGVASTPARPVMRRNTRNAERMFRIQPGGPRFTFIGSDPACARAMCRAKDSDWPLIDFHRASRALEFVIAKRKVLNHIRRWAVPSFAHSTFSYNQFRVNPAVRWTLKYVFTRSYIYSDKYSMYSIMFSNMSSRISKGTRSFVAQTHTHIHTHTISQLQTRSGLTCYGDGARGSSIESASLPCVCA